MKADTHSYYAKAVRNLEEDPKDADIQELLADCDADIQHVEDYTLVIKFFNVPLFAGEGKLSPQFLAALRWIYELPHLQLKFKLSYFAPANLNVPVDEPVSPCYRYVKVNADIAQANALLALDDTQKRQFEKACVRFEPSVRSPDSKASTADPKDGPFKLAGKALRCKS